MHLALVRSPGNKTYRHSTIQGIICMQYDPIFSAFFVFSYRKKRKIIVEQNDILGIISSPKETINNVLRKCNVNIASDINLPKQMEMFEKLLQ